MTQYAGSDWIEKQMKFVSPEIKMSDVGRNVADLLGELFYGIYHLDHKALKRVDWGNTHHIEVSIGWQCFSTADDDKLTRLVFLAHHMAIRVELSASTHKHIRIVFHQRKRSGDMYERHRTLDQAIQAFETSVTIPEFVEAAEQPHATDLLPSVANG